MLLSPAYLVRDSLAGTLDLCRADPRVLMDFFAENPPAIVAEVLDFFAQWQPDDFGPAYANQERTLPAIAVKSLPTSQIDHYIGASFGTWFDADSQTVVEMVGSRDQGSCEITIFAQSEEDVDILSTWVYAALEFHRDAFDEVGYNEMEVSASTIEPDSSTLSWDAWRVTITVAFRFNATVAHRSMNGILNIEVNQPIDEISDTTKRSTFYAYP